MVRYLLTFARAAVLGGSLIAAAALMLGPSAPVAPARSDAGDDWLVLSSNRDGSARVYSVTTNGERLSPLFSPGPPRLVPVGISRNGDRLAYIGGKDAPDLGPLYVSRPDGTALVRVGQATYGLQEFSPDGKLIAFTGKRGIWIVGSDGHGLRRLTSRGEEWFDWSPDSKALVVVRVLRKNPWNFGPYGIVVQPLRGKSRIVVRTGPHDDDYTDGYQPQWSPNGRWIAYINHEEKTRRNGLTLVRPNGTGRHRVVNGTDEQETYQWSADGRWLAFEDSSELDYIATSGAWHKISKAVIGPVLWSPDGKKLVFGTSKGFLVGRADGRRLRRLRLGVGGWLGLQTWSPDSTHFAFSGGAGRDPRQIWVVGSDGTGLRRLTNEGANDLVGWTRVAPLLPPAPPNAPTEHVLDANTVATSTPVEALSADGQRLAFVTRPTLTDCFHVLVWPPGGGLERLGNLPAPCPGETTTGVTQLVLAGSRAAWAQSERGSNVCRFELASATLTDPVPREVSSEFGVACKPDLGHLRGDGDLLVYNDEAHRRPWLVRLGVGGRKCGALPCATLRKGAQAAPVDAASGGLIAIKKRATVTVLDDQGRLVHTFRFAPADVSAARLDAGHLVVARSYTVESYEVTTGTREHSQPLPAGYQLTDVDDGIAVLRRAQAIMVLRLDTGTSLTLAPGQAPMYADLETPGLYYSYATGDGGRVVFLSRAELLRQLGGS
jgi:Tol biopolymer transport system component